MNHREPPHVPVGVRRALHCLSLLLLPALTTENQFAATRQRAPVRSMDELQEMEPVPYLPYSGAPPLRFQKLAPPPDLVTHPPAGAPPRPSAANEVELATVKAAVSITNSSAARDGADPKSADPKAATPAPEAKPVKPTPAPILPDDTRAPVRPEDFLPFFQLPGAATQNGDVTLVVPAARGAPAPAPLPPSSATYTQK